VDSAASAARTLTAGGARHLRVAIVTETFLPKMDGIVRFLLEMLAYLRRHGHEALVFCPGPGVATVAGYQVVRAAGLRFPPYPELRLTLRSARMVAALRAWRPDVVHLAGPVLLGAQGLRVARLLGVPAAGHYQTNLPQYVRHYGAPWLAPVVWRYLVALHNRCACTYTPTEIVAADCRRHGMRRVQALPRGVDSAAFAPHFRNEALRRSWGVLPDQVAFLYAGRVAPEKNLLRLAELPKAVPGSRLVIVGDGPFRAALTERLGSAAHFTGQLHGEALAAAFASADVFAFPSLTETFGLVVLEALASGLPVLAMRAGGVPAVVEDGQTGLLCDPVAPDAWIDGARRLAGSATLRRTLGTHGRSVAVGRTWDATFDRLLADYRQLALRDHGPSWQHDTGATALPRGWKRSVTHEEANE
jgi:glycosyltransferase involved in cell wall biosynthesis